MRIKRKFVGQREVITRFAWYPKTLPTETGCLFTVFLSTYKVEVVYETSRSFLSFLLSPDSGFTRYLIKKELHKINY
jgi:hypothetical protein